MTDSDPDIRIDPTHPADNRTVPMGMCGVLDPLPLPLPPPLVLAVLVAEPCVCVCPLVATTPAPEAPPEPAAAPLVDGGMATVGVVTADAACGSVLTVAVMAMPVADGTVAYEAVGVEAEADEEEDAT
jgi:hypothetical protein